MQHAIRRKRETSQNVSDSASYISIFYFCCCSCHFFSITIHIFFWKKWRQRCVQLRQNNPGRIINDTETVLERCFKPIAPGWHRSQGGEGQGRRQQRQPRRQQRRRWPRWRWQRWRRRRRRRRRRDDTLARGRSRGSERGSGEAPLARSQWKMRLAWLMPRHCTRWGQVLPSIFFFFFFFFFLSFFLSFFLFVLWWWFFFLV